MLFKSTSVREFKPVFESQHCNLLLGWCKSNCGFCIMEIYLLILEYILNKCGYVKHHFNMHFSLYLFIFFANDLLEKEMAIHSRILAWRIPWTEEPGGLQSMGLQELDMT